jgi:hypothetical protein
MTWLPVEATKEVRISGNIEHRPASYQLVAVPALPFPHSAA